MKNNNRINTILSDKPYQANVVKYIAIIIKLISSPKNKQYDANLKLSDLLTRYVSVQGDRLFLGLSANHREHGSTITTLQENIHQYIKEHYFYQFKTQLKEFTRRCQYHKNPYSYVEEMINFYLNFIKSSSSWLNLYDELTKKNYSNEDVNQFIQYTIGPALLFLIQSIYFEQISHTISIHDDTIAVRTLSRFINYFSLSRKMSDSPLDEILKEIKDKTQADIENKFIPFSDLFKKDHIHLNKIIQEYNKFKTQECVLFLPNTAAKFTWDLLLQCAGKTKKHENISSILSFIETENIFFKEFYHPTTSDLAQKTLHRLVELYFALEPEKKLLDKFKIRFSPKRGPIKENYPHIFDYLKNTSLSESINLTYSRSEGDFNNLIELTVINDSSNTVALRGAPSTPSISQLTNTFSSLTSSSTEEEKYLVSSLSTSNTGAVFFSKKVNKEKSSSSLSSSHLKSTSESSFKPFSITKK